MTTNMAIHETFLFCGINCLVKLQSLLLTLLSVSMKNENKKMQAAQKVASIFRLKHFFSIFARNKISLENAAQVLRLINLFAFNFLQPKTFNFPKSLQSGKV